jgi:hypothetical protein
MNIHHVTAAVMGFAIALASAVIAPTPAAAASGKHATKSLNGLTCRSSWYHTYGGTKCAGDSQQKWRLHVTCQMFGDHTGMWNWGPGEDGYECLIGITNASVEWGNQ